MSNNQHSPWGSPSNKNKPEPDKGSMKSFIIIIIIVVLIISLIAWFLTDGLSTGQSASLVYDFLLIALIGAGLIGHIIGNPGQALRNIAGWVIISGILGLGYTIWNGNSMLSGELNPSIGQINGNSVTYRADLSGHYMVRAAVNGVEIDFIIDTGATNVVLNTKDALKIGFDIDQLSFNVPASTANGVVYSAPVRLKSMVVGPIRFENIEGYVNQGELDVSLLGMSFLNKLSGYEVREGLLTLYP